MDCGIIPHCPVLKGLIVLILIQNILPARIPTNNISISSLIYKQFKKTYSG